MGTSSDGVGRIRTIVDSLEETSLTTAQMLVRATEVLESFQSELIQHAGEFAPRMSMEWASSNPLQSTVRWWCTIEEDGQKLRAPIEEHAMAVSSRICGGVSNSIGEASGSRKMEDAARSFVEISRMPMEHLEARLQEHPPSVVEAAAYMFANPHRIPADVADFWVKRVNTQAELMTDRDGESMTGKDRLMALAGSAVEFDIVHRNMWMALAADCARIRFCRFYLQTARANVQQAIEDLKDNKDPEAREED
tara:strand:- start:49 stop:801 length:753 start_codon:yes stop_codon:yes gene_type:complete